MSAIHKQALERFKLGTEAIRKQLTREEEDLKFQIPEPEFQWSAEAQAMRKGSLENGVAVNAKPMLCIPKLDQPIQLVLNQEKAAHLGVQVHALSEEADDDTADVLQGLYRRIEVDSRAGLARSWAYERAVKCGRGAYRVLTEYADDGGHYRDQKIAIKRLLHQESVVLDPFAEEPDWSDGRWGFIATWMPWEKYQAKYPKSKLAGYDEDALLAALTDCPDWMTGEGEGRAVLVAEYFYLETAMKNRVTYDDGSDGYDDEIPEGKKLHPTDALPKPEEVRTLKWCVINGIEELESKEMDGRYIPIIPVIGREAIPFDKDRRWLGVYTSNKDGARMFNYAASQAVTKAALEPLSPFILDPRQIEGYEAWWNEANTRQFPYLPAMMDVNKGWGPPGRTQTDVNQLGPSMMLIQSADSFLHAGTGAFEAALGQGSPQNKTKGGILALQQQQEQGNSHFLDNLAQISLTYEAKVVLDLIPSVYDRPGRVVRTLDLEDNSKTVMLNQPFTMGQNKRPQAHDPSMPTQGKVLHYDLKKGRYGVAVKVGKSYDSRAAEGSDALSTIMQAEPELMPIIGPVWAKFQQWPGHQEVADTLKKMRDHNMPWLSDEDDPQQAEQQLGQAKAALQQMQQQMQEMAKALETDRVKVEGQVTQTKIKASADLQIAYINNATKFGVARIMAAKAGLDSVREGQEEALGTGLQLQHEATQNAMDRQHELNQAQLEHEHALAQAQQGHEQAVAQAEQGQAHALQQGDQGQQNALEQQQQAADLAPEPTSGE